MIISFFLAFCILEVVETNLQGSSCTIPTAPSSALTVGVEESVVVDCSIVNTGSSDQSFYLFLSASQNVPRDILSYPCSASTCVQPAINISSSSITTSSQLEEKPLLKNRFSNEGVIAVFEGSVPASNTISVQVQGELYVGNLYVVDTSTLIFTTSLRQDLNSSPVGTHADATIQVSNIPSLSTLATLKSGKYLRIGENDQIRFTMSAVSGSSNLEPSVIQIYSNYILQIYQVLHEGTQVSATHQMTVIASAEINSPCASDLCNINARPIYKYEIDVSANCCPQNTENEIEIDYYLYETPTNESSVFVEVYLRLVTTDVPLYVVGRYFQTFPVNPGLSILKTASVSTDDILPQVFGIQIVVDNPSPVNIYNATLSDNVNGLKVIENSNRKTPSGSDWTEVNSQLVATLDNVSTTQSNLVYSYDVSLFGNGESFPVGKQWREVTFTFYLISASEAINGYLGKRYQISPECPLCFQKDFQTVVNTEEVYDFVIVAILICFILGFLLMLLILAIMVLCMGFSAVVTISPVADEESAEEKERRMRKQVRGKRRAARQKRHEIRAKNKQQVTKSAVLMKKMKLYFLGSKEAYDSALSSLTSTSSLDYEDCSLVQVLALEDAEKAEKELSCCDIGESIGLDKKVDQYRIQAMLSVVTLLLKSFVESKNIDTQLADRLVKKVHLSVSEIQQSSSKDEKLEMEKVLRRLRRTHERKIMKLRLKQLDERKYKSSLLKKERKADRHNILQILDKQHRKELDDLAFVLQLERFHAVENLRKTKAIEFRLKVKGAINHILIEHSPQFSRQCSDLESSSGSSVEEKEESAKLEMYLAFVRREFVNHVNNIENALDSHLTGVKGLMDEKLSWRQHFVSQKQLIIERQRQALNLIAEHIKRFLETQISLGRLEDKDRNVWLTRMSADLLAMREARLVEQGRQTSSLTQSKTATLKEMKNNHFQKFQEMLETFDKENFPAVINGQSDVKKFLDDRFQLITDQSVEYGRQQMTHDLECSKEYMDLVQAIFEKVYNALEKLTRSYVKDLKENGCEEEEADTLIQQFHRDKERMKINVEEQLVALEESQKKQMVKKSKKWQQIRFEEKAAQETLRQHEERLVKQMVDSKVSVSEGESELQRRLEAEREQLLAAVETSLTMKKLWSQLELHQLLYTRRERRLEKLINAQIVEHQVRQERKRLETEDMTDEEFVKSQISERVHKTVVSIPKAKMREALYQIDEQLMREKLKNIQKQEERIATFVVAQELQKARELAKIEEQHQRLIKLKMCLLTDVGLKHSKEKSKEDKTGATAENTSAAGHLLANFEEKRTQMDHLLRDEKARQDDKLRHKIAARAQMRNRTADSMLTITDSSKNMNEMAKIIIEAHSNEFEEASDEKQIEEMTHKKFHKKKLEAMQKQEEDMIASLVNVAGLSSSELMSVLLTVFPDRSGSELQQMCSRLAVTTSDKKYDTKATEEILPVQSDSAEQIRKLIRMELMPEESEDAKSR